LTNTLEKLGSRRQKTPRDDNEGSPFGRDPEKEIKRSDAAAAPEYCLARFVDVTVEPGKSYEYRFKIRMRNPNFKRAEDVIAPEFAKEEYLASSWVQLPRTITVPSDFAFYAVDQKELDPKRFLDAAAEDKDQAAIQLYRWLDMYNPFDERNPHPVGDWAVSERVLVHVGQYIGGTHGVELPIWSWSDERFVLASNPGDRKNKRVPVAFTEENEIAPLLVGYIGGQVEFNGVQERVPRELLVLMPNGRLAARNSAADVRDPERLQRSHDWRRRVEEIKTAGARRK
jgi:hypothetical protein